MHKNRLQSFLLAILFATTSNIAKINADGNCLSIKTSTIKMNFIALKDFYLIEKTLLNEKNCQAGYIKKNTDGNILLQFNKNCTIKPQNPNETKKYNRKPGIIYLDPRGQIKIILEQQNELDYTSEKNFIFGYLINAEQTIQKLKLIKKTPNGQTFTISIVKCKTQ